jgi:paraquat-inducible protein B
MSDQTPPTAVIHSRLDRRRRLSLIWAIPIVTALIGGWLAWRALSERGPLITITFEAASGLIAGQSHVRHKDVDMGLVEHIGLSRDLQKVVVTVRMTREAQPLLTDKAMFWVVRPRFFAGALTGLETLVSGSYIELQPAAEGGTPQRAFAGLEAPPVLTSDVPGHTFLLQAPRIGNISLGSPVFYRDLPAGEVLGWDIGNMAESVTIHAFVREPFDKYVHDDSRFWNASGASVTLGANGLQLQLESIRALLLGGIAFETPGDSTGRPVSAQNHVFPLYVSQEEAEAAGFPRKIEFVANFSSSVAGLSPAAPVTLRGLKIGEVRSVGLQYDNATDSIIVPVHFWIAPDHVNELHLPVGGDLDAVMRDLVRRGLRAKLDSVSLITGQKQLAVDIYPDAPAASLETDNGIYVMPVLSSGSQDLTAVASSLAAKLDSIPFDQIGQNLNQTLAGLNGVVNGAELKQSLAALHSTLANAEALTQHLNDASGPVLQRLPAIASELESAVRKVDALVGSVQSSYGGNSTFANDAQRLLVQLNDTARSFRVLADLLARHPEALIRGRTDQGSP